MIIQDMEQVSIEGDGHFKKTYQIIIDSVDDWKFGVWVDLINAYDDFKKSRHKVSEYKKLLIEDYEKDFKDD